MTVVTRPPDARSDIARVSAAAKQRGWWQSRAWRKFIRHRLAMAGAVTLIAMALASAFAPWLAPHGPYAVDPFNAEQPPSLEHPLGTDPIGRDILARVLWGGRVSLTVGFGAVALYTFIGTVLGVVSGYFGGFVDTVIQRVIEVILTFPGLVILILTITLIGPGLRNLILAIGLFGWPAIARIVRAEVLSLREREFVMAARCLGMSGGSILLRHIVPNVLAQVIVAATLGVAITILTESGLSFLGLGVPPPMPSWGVMMQEGLTLRVLETRPWMWLPPGLAIALCVLSVNFVGDGLRDALDPRTQGQRIQ